MNDRYYLAYGSNLSTEQMAHRCPGAVYVGTAVLPDHQLVFKRSGSGFYLTVVKKPGRCVPLAVWQISAYHEQQLDHYEGCPESYQKTIVPVDMYTFPEGAPAGRVEGIIYILPEDRPSGMPTDRYFRVCMTGYKHFGFDTGLMEQALVESVGKEQAERFLSTYSTV